MVGTMQIERTLAISYTKQRTMFGAVGIEVDPQKKIAYVRLAKQWKRDDMNSIPDELKELFDKIKWNNTFCDYQVGLHLIRNMEHKLGFQVHTITTQKNLKEVENIDTIKVMDITEITQLTLSLKQVHKIQFPKDHYTKDMEDLMQQMEMFTEHVTEQGTVSYYAPGDELDSLPRALMIAVFGNRIKLMEGDMPFVINTGFEEQKQKTAVDVDDELLRNTLGMDSGDMSTHHITRMNRTNMFRPKLW